MNTMSRRTGITIIEVLVVISILALIAAILLPAVMHVREGQRRMVCQSQLKDLSLALAQFHAVHGKYPRALDGGPTNSKNLTSSFSPQAYLLPYLDQVPLYNRVNFSLVTVEPLNPAISQGVLAPVSGKQISSFVCPSDNRGSGILPGNSYRACLGIGPLYGELPGRTDGGAFIAGKNRRAADFLDGLGTTVAFSERRLGSWESDYVPHDDIWYAGIDELGIQPPLNEMLQLCAMSSGTPAEIYQYMGSLWLYGSFENTWYVHARRPNEPAPACSSGILGVPIGPRTSNAVVGASSRHRQGVNTAFMDGAVKFVSDEIDLDVWRALSTIRAKEPISALP